MLLDEPAHLGKHDAEESPYEGYAVKKQRWEQSPKSDDLECRDMLEWELEQERWSEKTHEAILRDPQWQRVGIKSESSSSDDEQQQSMTPTIMSPNQAIQERESPRQPMSGPARLYSPTDPGPYFIEDNRLLQRPPSPGMSVHSAPRMGAILSPSNNARPTSPAASVRSASTYFRNHDQQPNYSTLYPTTPTGGRTVNNWPADPDGEYMSPTNDQLEPAHLTMRMKPFSSPPTVQPRLSTSGRLPYSGMNRDDGHGMNSPLLDILRAKSPILSPAQQSVQGAASWNSHRDADQLEAEFHRLETDRVRNLAFPGIEERDEQDARRSTQDTKTVYGLDELEQEYERLEIRNQEVVNLEDAPEIIVAPDEEHEILMALEEHDDGVIHLEDQPSLGEDEPEENSADRPIGVQELEAEFEDAVRRKALMRNCSMNSNEGDDILGDSVREAMQEESSKRTLPSRKARWQEKLERFERRGLEVAEANSDVSKYPRLQQIRQRRRERLKALMSMRQERAEIWSTLEANWEHMENSMTRTLEREAKNRGGQDPEPDNNEADVLTKVEGAEDAPTSEDDMNHNNSLQLSDDSEPDSQDPEAVKDMKAEPGHEEEEDEATPSPEMSQEGAAVVVEKNHPSETGKELRVTEKQNRAESPKLPRSPRPPRNGPTSIAKALERPSSPGKTSTASLMDSISCTSPGKNREESVISPSAQEERVDENPQTDGAAQKQDPPPTSFGVYLSRSMSDAGAKVANIMKNVRSQDEQKPSSIAHQQSSIVLQQTETAEEDDTSHHNAHDDDDDDDDASNGTGLDMVTYDEDEELESETQGCANPLQSLLLGKQRRIVVEQEGCINPFLTFGLERAAQMCAPTRKVPKVRNDPHKASVSARKGKLPMAHSDMEDDDSPQVYVIHDLSDGDMTYETPLNGSHSLSYDNSTTAVTTRKHHQHHNRRSKKSKRKRAAAKTTKATAITKAEAEAPVAAEKLAAAPSPTTSANEAAPEKEKGSGSGGVDTFFTLVDDLLVNKILSIVDEKSVNSMAHTFGFD